MKNQKFMQVFRTLSLSERKQFADYLRMHHTRDSNMYQLLDYVSTLADGSRLGEINNKVLIKKLFGGTPNTSNRKDLSDLFSKLNRHLEEYMVVERVKKEKGLYDWLLARELLDRKAHDRFAKHIAKSQQRTAATEKDSVDDLLFGWLIAELAYFHPSSEKQNGSSALFSVMLETANQLAYTVRAKYEVEYLFRKAASQQDATKYEHFVQPSGWETLLPTADLGRLGKFLGQILDILRSTPMVASLEVILPEYKGLLPRLPPFEASIVFGFMVNATAQLIKSGQEDAHYIAFDLYQHGLEQGVLLQNGYITNTQFATIVYLSCKNNNTAWARVFIVESAQLLMEETRQPVVELARGEVEFAEGLFLAAFCRVEGVNIHKDANFKFRKKNLQLKCLAELHLKELPMPPKTDLQDFIRSFKTFVLRTKQASEANKTAMLNFIQCTDKLVWSKATPDEMRASMDEMALLYNKAWLLEKLEKPRKQTLG